MELRSQEQDELYELIDAQCEDRLSPAELERLELLLRENVRSRELYLQAMEVQGLLERFDAARDDCFPSRASEAEQPQLRRSASGTLKQKLLRRPRSISATAAAIVVGSVVALLAMLTAPIYLRQRQLPEEIVAQHPEAWLSATYEAEWGDDAPEGKALRAGKKLKLSAGMAEVSFRSGTKTVLTAPIELEVAGDNELKLLRGALTAHVPQEAIGFRVTTKGAVVTDLGTEFGVNVDDEQRSYVEVFQGRVRLDPTAVAYDEQAGVVLSAGQTATADAAGLKVNRSSPTTTPAEPFTRRMPERLQVLSDPADGHYAFVPGQKDLQLGTSSPGNLKTTRIGAGGEFGGNKRIIAVYYFPLPQLTGGRKLLNAELRFHYIESQGPPRFAVDLYALPGRDEATFARDEFYVGPSDERFPKIAAGVLKPDLQRGSLSVRSQQLSAYLAELYNADGTPRTKYAVLRFNPASDPGDGYSGYAISMRENAEAQVTGPHLVLHIMPETGSGK